MIDFCTPLNIFFKKNYPSAATRFITFLVYFCALFPFAGCNSQLIINCDGSFCESNRSEFTCHQANFIYFSVSQIENAQVLQVIEDKVYLFGADKEGMGIVVELDSNLVETGWVGYLSYFSQNLISHPSGVAYKDGFPTFIGASIGNKSFLYQIIWPNFIRDKNLDNALASTIRDTISLHGIRPEYIYWDSSWNIATSDYNSSTDSQFRIFDVVKLTEAETTDDNGVTIHSSASESYIQDLFWSDDYNQLLLIQNSSYVKGWRISFVDTNSMYYDSSKNIGDLITNSVCFSETSELESFGILPDHTLLFLSATLPNNLSLYNPGGDIFF